MQAGQKVDYVMLFPLVAQPRSRPAALLKQNTAEFSREIPFDVVYTFVEARLGTAIYDFGAFSRKDPEIDEEG